MHSKQMHYNFRIEDLDSRHPFSDISLLPGHVHLWASGATFLNCRKDYKNAKVEVDLMAS